MGLNWNYKTEAEWLTRYDTVLKNTQSKFTNVAPKLYVPDCSAFMGAGPHYTAGGIKIVAKVCSDYYVNDQ